MKIFYRLVLSIIVLVQVSLIEAQTIQNSDFEEWTFNGSEYQPTGWLNEDPDGLNDIFQDNVAYSGDLAINVLPISFTGDDSFCFGHVYQTIDISFIPEVLHFYAKWDKNSIGSVSVSITFYNGLEVQSEEVWTPTINMSDWTEITMSLAQIEPIITHATIRINTQGCGFAAGFASISIDDISFDSSNGVDELLIDNITIAPNPCSDILRVSAKYESIKNSVISIFDLSGRLLYRNDFSSEIDVTSYPVGSYIIELKDGPTVLTDIFTIKR